MDTTPKTAAAPPDDVHLIVAKDEDFVIEYHPEDWIAFALFWALAFIVFLQFFTRTSLFALVDIVTLGFMGLLAYFSISITDRMQAQTMTVFDLPMSLVYGGVAFGCFLMVIRQAVTVWSHARQRWQKADDFVHQLPID